ncbi:MAG: HYR domain-containing protein, partial [Flavobacteriaceae bacterium]|nr:HYR domain-containing protein [Flavobacteriaceae bacterium]
MKKITLALVAVAVMCFTWQVQAQTEIPQADATLTAGVDFVDGDIYTDSGGSTGSYLNDELSTINFVANAGEQLIFTFTAFEVEASGGGGGQCWDNLTVTGDTGGFDGTYAGDTFDAGAGLVCMDATDGAGNPTLGPFTSSDGGTLSFLFDSDGSVTQSGWEATITVMALLGDPPVMTCPMDVTTTASTGTCGAIVAFPPPLVTDPDGDLDTVVQTAGPMSGEEFPVGTTVVEFTATDLAGNSSTCSFNVTVTDDEDPMAVCMDITVQLDANGEYVLTPGEIDGGSTDNCGIASLEIAGTPSPFPAGLYAMFPWQADNNIARYDYNVSTDAIALVDNPYASSGLDTNYALDKNPANGMVYILGDSPSTGNRALFTYDLVAGSTMAELGDVVSSGGLTNPNSMAFGNDGTLYVSYGDGTIETLDVGTMTSSAFATPPQNGGGIGLTYDSDGDRLIYSNNNFGTGENDIYAIDTSGTDTLLFSFTVPTCGSAQAMEYVGGGKVVASTTFGCSTIYTFDLATGTPTVLLNPDGFFDNIKALLFDPGLVPMSDLLLTCADVGTNTVTLVVTDDSGNQATCEAMVTVEDVTAPVITCIGEPAIFSYLQEFESSSLPMNWSTEVVSGGFDWTFGSGDMPIGGDFASNAAIFDDDAIGSGELDNTVRLISPVFDLDGAIVANLSFEYALQDFAGSGNFSVEVWDGAAWQEILFVTEDTDPTNTGVMDMLAYANDSFQVRFTYDDDDDWAWGAGVDNFAFDWEFPPSAPLLVELDANGMATIDASLLLDNVNEACGYTVEVAGQTTTLGSLYAMEAGFTGTTTDNIARYGYDSATDDITLEDNPYASTTTGGNYSLAVNPADGMGYLLADSPGTGNRALFEYDLATGTLGAEIGDVVSAGGAANPNAMTFGTDGTLYISFGTGDINTFDVGTATSTAFATAPQNGGGIGLTYDSDAGAVIYANWNSATTEVDLYSID